MLIYKRLYDFFKTHKRCTGVLARNFNGDSVAPESESACSYCFLGGFDRATFEFFNGRFDWSKTSPLREKLDNDAKEYLKEHNIIWDYSFNLMPAAYLNDVFFKYDEDFLNYLQTMAEKEAVADSENALDSPATS